MLKILLTACLIFSLKLFAHPVSFKGSVPITWMNEERKTEAITTYSIKYWWGVGSHYFRIEDNKKDLDALFAKTNFLLKRWNKKDSQANIYAWLGAGALWNDNSHFTYLTGIQADYETRRIYTEATFRSLRTFDNSEVVNIAQASFGLSPYLAGYEDLQSWMIVRGNYTPELEDQWMISTLLRFFYRNVFWEMGANHKGHPIINLMVHF
ncbi:hypothetical protein MRY82_06525 [bacterium]|nr:hypothetical protein [bacterium]